MASEEGGNFNRGFCRGGLPFKLLPQKRQWTIWLWGWPCSIKIQDEEGKITQPGHIAGP